MLELKNITKDYISGDEKVEALKGINLKFRESEFVSILGQSGCGKTTLLNIIGGLDRYTSGDLVINGKSTKDFKDRDYKMENLLEDVAKTGINRVRFITSHPWDFTDNMIDIIKKYDFRKGVLF